MHFFGHLHHLDQRSEHGQAKMEKSVTLLDDNLRTIRAGKARQAVPCKPLPYCSLDFLLALLRQRLSCSSQSRPIGEGLDHGRKWTPVARRNDPR